MGVGRRHLETNAPPFPSAPYPADPVGMDGGADPLVADVERHLDSILAAEAALGQNSIT